MDLLDEIAGPIDPAKLQADLDLLEAHKLETPKLLSVGDKVEVIARKGRYSSSSYQIGDTGQVIGFHDPQDGSAVVPVVQLESGPFPLQECYLRRIEKGHNSVMTPETNSLPELLQPPTAQALKPATKDVKQVNTPDEVRIGQIWRVLKGSFAGQELKAIDVSVKIDGTQIPVLQKPGGGKLSMARRDVEFVADCGGKPQNNGGQPRVDLKPVSEASSTTTPPDQRNGLVKSVVENHKNYGGQPFNGVEPVSAIQAPEASPDPVVADHKNCGVQPQNSLEALSRASSRVSALGIDSTGWIDEATSNGKIYYRLRRYEGKRITAKNLKPSEVSKKRDEIERARVVEAIALLVDYFERNAELLDP